MAPSKKYICAFCARAFTRSEHKQRHERSHTNEKPFHCLYCTSSFVRRDLLQRHCRTVHNSSLNPKTLPTNKSLNNPTINGFNIEIDQPNEINTDTPETIDSIPMTPSNSINSEIVKKRRKSSQDSTNDTSHDILHLLSITKKLDNLLMDYDYTNIDKSTISDHFLIGYINLLNKSKNEYLAFDKILKDLIYYLNTFYINQPPQNLETGTTSPLINDFRIGLLYSTISLGFILNKQEYEAISYFKKSWNLLIKKLIPQYNNNNNLLDQIEIMNNLNSVNYNLYIPPNQPPILSSSTSLNLSNSNNTIISNNGQQQQHFQQANQQGSPQLQLQSYQQNPQLNQFQQPNLQHQVPNHQVYNLPPLTEKLKETI
ncbi:unnamed protein product [Candida verbasci]|uniref:C2H2-type domain-containing protein n=1 Tax=Candida verbasci TaxID=1227364 RepID=A0A9W4U074_9ASCO|nr:unnamed protein product [Candida verbasci]